jgi:Protein of unknown function DUF262
VSEAGSSLKPQRFLEATTSTVAWFWNRLREGTLNMRPPYQRNPVWQETQKAYLIDTILRGYPVPELYLQTSVTGQGLEQHIIVDGQQRIRACLEFIDNEFTLGDDSEKYAGLSFDELNEDVKKQIFQYKFVVRQLPELDDVEIREIFGRLNRNNMALNRQELRKATYWGEFITSMTDLSQLSFWVNSGLFTTNDFRRMLDIEYISELAVALLFGPQNKKAQLDDYYATFEQEFPDKERVERAFNIILAELTALLEWPTTLRWSRKVDFYTLFLVLGSRVEEMPFDRQERDIARERLTQFSSLVTRLLSMREEDRDTASDSKAALAYARGVRNSSDLNSRRLRLAALDAFLRGIEYEAPRRQEGGLLKSLPSSEELMSASADQVPDEDEDEDDA